MWKNSLRRDSGKRPLFVILIIGEVTKEVLEFCSRLGDSKLTSIKSLPSKAHKLAVRSRPDTFVELFETCLMNIIS